MTDPNLYDYSDYKSFFTDLTKARQAIYGTRVGLLSGIARAAQCNRSFVTQVLRSKLHFNPDQIFRVSAHLKFNERQTSYLLALLEYSRATDPDYRLFVQRKIGRIRRKRKLIENERDRTWADALKAGADSLEGERPTPGVALSAIDGLATQTMRS